MNKLRVLEISGGCVSIDEADWPGISQYTWYIGSHGYACAYTGRGAERRCILMHRLLTSAPRGTHVDHIDGDRLNNTRGNLRVTTPSLNQVNRKRLNTNNTSGHRGVSWMKSKNKWRAQICANNIMRHIGLFDRKQDAVAARKAAELALWGEAAP